MVLSTCMVVDLQHPRYPKMRCHLKANHLTMPNLPPEPWTRLSFSISRSCLLHYFLGWFAIDLHSSVRRHHSKTTTDQLSNPLPQTRANGGQASAVSGDTLFLWPPRPVQPTIFWRSSVGISVTFQQLRRGHGRRWLRRRVQRLLGREWRRNSWSPRGRVRRFGGGRLRG